MTVNYCFESECAVAEDNDNYYFINTSLCHDLRGAERSTDLGQGTGRSQGSGGNSGAERDCSVPPAQCRGQPERTPPADGAGHAPPPALPAGRAAGPMPRGCRAGRRSPAGELRAEPSRAGPGAPRTAAGGAQGARRASRGLSSFQFSLKLLVTV